MLLEVHDKVKRSAVERRAPSGTFQRLVPQKLCDPRG